MPAAADVLIVVHNQLPFVKACLASVRKFSRTALRLFVWDNGSDVETGAYLRDAAERGDIVLHRADRNQGFIVPNNRMAAAGRAPYLVLLNSDTIVTPDWDVAMFDHLARHPRTGIVGYGGGLLDENAVGRTSPPGVDIDYVEGWCACIPRRVFEEVGLFDEHNLQFAYGEDSDLCLRIREADYDVQALTPSRVHHFGGRTSRAVARERDLGPSFRANHAYLRRRWGVYLATSRGVRSAPPEVPRTAPGDEALG